MKVQRSTLAACGRVRRGLLRAAFFPRARRLARVRPEAAPKASLETLRRGMGGVVLCAEDGRPCTGTSAGALAVIAGCAPGQHP